MDFRGVRSTGRGLLMAYQDQDRKIQFSDRLGDSVLGNRPRRPREIIETIYSTIRVKPVLISDRSVPRWLPVTRLSLNLHNCFLMIWIIVAASQMEGSRKRFPEVGRPSRSIIDYYGPRGGFLPRNVMGNYYRGVYLSLRSFVAQPVIALPFITVI